MKKKSRLIAFIILGLVFLAIFFILNDKLQKKNLNKKLDTQILSIKKIDFNNKISEKEKFYASKNQKFDEETLEKDVLENLKKVAILSFYAEKNNILVSVQEIEKRYEAIVLAYNARNKIKEKDDSQYLKKIEELYGMDKASYLEVIREDILREKVQNSLKMPLNDWLVSEMKKIEIDTSEISN